MKRLKVTAEGYGVVDARAGPGGNSARVYVPLSWKGKNIRCILLDDPDEPAPSPEK